MDTLLSPGFCELARAADAAKLCFWIVHYIRAERQEFDREKVKRAVEIATDGLLAELSRLDKHGASGAALAAYAETAGATLRRTITEAIAEHDPMSALKAMPMKKRVEIDAVMSFAPRPGAEASLGLGEHAHDVALLHDQIL